MSFVYFPGHKYNEQRKILCVIMFTLFSRFFLSQKMLAHAGLDGKVAPSSKSLLIYMISSHNMVNLLIVLHMNKYILVSNLYNYFPNVNYVNILPLTT